LNFPLNLSLFLLALSLVTNGKEKKRRKLNTAALDPLYDSRIEKKSLRKRGKVGKKNTDALDPLHDSRIKEEFKKEEVKVRRIRQLWTPIRTAVNRIWD